VSKRPSSTFNDPGHFYNQKRLLQLFTLSSAALVVGILAMIWADFDRPWKDEQREHRVFVASKFALEQFVLQTQTQKTRAALDKRREAARKIIDAHAADLAEVRKKLRSVEGEFYLADMNYKEQKQYTGEAEYNVHEAKTDAGREAWTKRLRKERDREHRFRDATQDALARLDHVQAQAKEIQAALDAVVSEERKNPGLKRLEILAMGIEKNRSYNPAREIPLLDFLAPPTKVEQVVLDQLVDNYEFSTPKKVDRCGTCHIGSMRLGSESRRLPVEILDKGYKGSYPGERADRFEEAIYLFVYGILDSITAKTPKQGEFAHEDALLRQVDLHHRALSFMFKRYDRETGDIGRDENGRKIWRTWSWSEKKNRWIKSKKGHSVAEHYLSLLKRMKKQWQTHPHYGDMVGDRSPHPYERMGCTTCHQGRGWSTDFGFAYHMPDRKEVDDFLTTERAHEEGHHLPLNANATLEDAMAKGNAADKYPLHIGFPVDHERGHEWEEERGWIHSKRHAWHWPQYPKMLVQASCLKCHKEGLYETPPREYEHSHIGEPDPAQPDLFDWESNSQTFPINDDPKKRAAGKYAGRIFIPKAEEAYRPRNLERGMDDFLRFGCYGCHKLESKLYPFMKTVRPKVGPPLDHIGTKVKMDWLLKWIENPKAFRPGTRMPRFFGLSNNSHNFRFLFADASDTEVEGPAWAEAEIYAISAWLTSESKRLSGDTKYPVADLSHGDADRGAAIVVGDIETSGKRAKACIACHTIPVPEKYGYDKDRLAKWQDKARKSFGWKLRMSRRQGPELSGIGSKVNKDWLVAWLLDPRGYWHDTNMPNLRLTDQEALDVAVFLMTLRDEAFEKKRSVVYNAATMKLVAQELKVSEQSESTESALSIVEHMSNEERTLYVGRKLVKHHGCFGCHSIDAYKTATPIGTELTEWGSKLIDRLEFNHAPIDKTRFDFAYTKMINPRIYDHGMPRADRPLERLKMPRFGFTAEEARDLSTFLVALVNDPIPKPSLFAPDGRQADIVRGRQIVWRYNCQACHVIEGKGGDIWGVVADSGRPPDLVGQGMKTNPLWLFKFMKDPTFLAIPGKAGTDRLRPWHSIRMPTFGLSDEEARALVRYFAALSEVTSEYETETGDSLTGGAASYAAPKTLEYADPTDPEKKVRLTVRTRLEEARAMYKAYACLSCHSTDPDVGLKAPDFRHTRGGRLRERWITNWLWHPGKMQPGANMPNFFGEKFPKPQLEAFFANPQGDKARQARDQLRAARDYVRYHYREED